MAYTTTTFTTLSLREFWAGWHAQWQRHEKSATSVVSPSRVFGGQCRLSISERVSGRNVATIENAKGGSSSGTEGESYASSPSVRSPKVLRLDLRPDAHREPHHVDFKPSLICASSRTNFPLSLYPASLSLFPYSLSLSLCTYIYLYTRTSIGGPRLFFFFFFYFCLLPDFFLHLHFTTPPPTTLLYFFYLFVFSPFYAAGAAYTWPRLPRDLHRRMCRYNLVVTSYCLCFRPPRSRLTRWTGISHWNTAVDEISESGPLCAIQVSLAGCFGSLCRRFLKVDMSMSRFPCS